MSVLDFVLLQYCVGYWSLAFPYKLLNRFVDNKITCWDFYWNFISSVDRVGKNRHLDNILSS